MAVLLSIAMAGVLAAPVSAISDDAPAPPDDLTAQRYVVVMEDVPNVTEFGRDGVTGSAAEARSVRLTASRPSPDRGRRRAQVPPRPGG